MKKVFISIACILVFGLTAIVAHAQMNAELLFFYGDGCPHCAKVEPFIDEFENQHPDIVIKKFEVYNDRSNLLLLDEYYEDFAVPIEQRGVPVVFFGEHMFVGDQPILDSLEQVVLTGGVSSQITTSESKQEDQSSNSKSWQILSVPTIIGAAVVDSINPCAIAVLLILLTALLATGERKRALWAGVAFTVSIYISYFIFGLGLFSVLHFSGLAYWFNKVIGIIAVIIGIANIKDYFWYGGGGFVMEIPRRWRPNLKKILKSVTTPIGAFLIGFLVSLFELPCTGGPYLVILSLLAERSTQFQAIPLLLLYNIFFILPLIIIAVLIFFGYTTIDRAENWKERNIRRLHLFAGLIMTALGLVIAIWL